jgi:hypothetical protein
MRAVNFVASTSLSLTLRCYNVTRRAVRVIFSTSWLLWLRSYYFTRRGVVMLACFE